MLCLRQRPGWCESSDFNLIWWSRNHGASKSELEGTVGIVWLNPLIFQVRALRAGELLRLVCNHPTQLGERENYTLGLRPQGPGISPPHRFPPSLLRCCASSTLVPMSLTYLFGLQSQVAPPSHLLLELISYPPPQAFRVGTCHPEEYSKPAFFHIRGKSEVQLRGIA